MTGPMKVLMTTDTIGGVWTYTVELCSALCTQGLSIELASMGRPLSREQSRQLAKIRGLRLHESDYRLCWMQDSWEDVICAGDWLRELEDHLQPDVIHLNDLAHGALAWRAPVLMVGHSCVYSWHQGVKRRSPAEDWRRYHSTVSASIAAVDLLAAPSHAMLDSLLTIYGPAQCQHVIYNGRDFFADSKVQLQRKRLKGAPNKKPLVLAAGRLWDEAKNITALTAIAADLHWPLYLAGETSAPGGTEHAKAAPNVRYLGRLNEAGMFGWMQRAGIYAAPAYYEPFGLGILEAAQSGCALVLGDIPSLRELWDGAAIFVAPDDRDQLCRSINELSQQDRRRQQLAASACQRARSFSTQHMANEYLAAYQHLLNSGHRLRSGVAR